MVATNTFGLFTPWKYRYLMRSKCLFGPPKSYNAPSNGTFSSTTPVVSSQAFFIIFEIRTKACYVKIEDGFKRKFDKNWGGDLFGSSFFKLISCRWSVL